MSLSNSLVIRTANCRGLRTHEKKVDVLNYLKNTEANVICLQDSHWLSSELREIKHIWNNPCYIHGSKTNSRGVAILFKSNFEFEVSNIQTDTEGNYMSIDLKVANDFTINIINVYGPNKDRPNFYNEIQKNMATNQCEYTIICGDLNVTLNPKLDSKDYLNVNNPNARLKILEIMENHDIVDSFRNLYPNLSRFTWANINKKARLDYFLVSNSLTDLIPEVNIKHGYRSDHSAVDLHITLNTFKRGKGTWKFNTSLLGNCEYIEMINNTIDEIKQQYLLPVYNPLDSNPLSNKDIQFTISDSLFLDTLLMTIRGKTIRFSSKLKKQQNTKETDLVHEIENLEKDPNLSQLTDLLNDKKEELQEIRKIKLKGNMIRSRAQWLTQGENPTKIFCALENKNFLDKTIKKISNQNNQIITNQEDILKELELYYTKLFESHDYELQDIDLEKLFASQNITKLTNDDRNKIQGKLTLNEVSMALKNMKNDKTPGIDGFPADFFKIFWIKLKYFVLRSLNQSYDNTKMSVTLRTGLITCLPKPNKPRELLKNWRPITLLNVIYKIASSAIANRLKHVLNSLISDTQTGFLDGRYIGESTRLVYDIMESSEKFNLDGLLVLIDFEKAFDSVSWNFIYKTLNFFNLGQDIINWVKLFNNDIFAYVTQSGFLSQKIQIKRGCRQGDPIASYVFILCTEILTLLIKHNQNIKGIKIMQNEFKMTQFADDTTLLLDGSQSSLTASLNTLEVFGSYSGLKMNTDKTKVIWIGRKKHSKDKLKTRYSLVWGEEEFDLLGLKFNVDLLKTTTINYNKAIIKINNTIKAWKTRYLTPIGKITVIKTFLLGQLIHLFMSIPNPNSEILNDINTKLFNFLWDGKPDKIKRNQTFLNHYDGGLKMINIHNFIKALKITWIRRLYRNPNAPFAKLFTSTITNINNLFILGPNFVKDISHKIKNIFWYQTLTAWTELNNKLTISESTDIYNTLLWHNPALTHHSIFFPTWANKGINMIGDLIGPNNTVLQKHEIELKINATINFLDYHRIKTLIKSYLEKHSNILLINCTIQRPLIPLPVTKLVKSIKGSKVFYEILQSNKIVHFNPKWNQKLNIEIPLDQWEKIYKSCFFSVTDNHLKWLQFKIINRILGTRSLLFKMKITNDPLCAFCKESEETIIHLFSECPQTYLLWKHMFSWINQVLHRPLNFNKTIILLGHLDNYNPIPINTILLTTKLYIFTQARQNKKLNIFQLQKKIKNIFIELEFAAKLQDKLETFNQIWQNLRPLMETP